MTAWNLLGRLHVNRHYVFGWRVCGLLQWSFFSGIIMPRANGRKDSLLTPVHTLDDLVPWNRAVMFVDHCTEKGCEGKEDLLSIPVYSSRVALT